MQTFDELRLSPEDPMGAETIKRLREASGVSKAELARIPNVTTSSDRQWERSCKRPT